MQNRVAVSVSTNDGWEIVLRRARPVKSVWVSVALTMMLAARSLSGGVAIPDFAHVDEITVYPVQIGWMARFQADGSATLNFGPAVRAEAPKHSISFFRVYSMVTTHLEETENGKKSVGVQLRVDGEYTTERLYMSDRETIKWLMEEVLAKSDPEQQKSLREVIEKHPFVSREVPGK
jgi:hypothetical protein